jgi:hypothetical protein
MAHIVAGTKAKEASKARRPIRWSIRFIADLSCDSGTLLNHT